MHDILREQALGLYKSLTSQTKGCNSPYIKFSQTKQNHTLPQKEPNISEFSSLPLIA